MRIAVASGKGGTGKTGVAVSLALSLAEAGPVTLIDADVEAPNARFFVGFDPDMAETVTILEPVIDAEICAGCGACTRACQFNALVMAKSAPVVFTELCHACGACALACPHGAISERPAVVGEIRTGSEGALTLIEGRIEIARPSTVPVIEAVRARHDGKGDAVIDGPPGAGCGLMAATRDVDAILLVTDPTPFGLHDLEIAAEAVRESGAPVGVVLNRDGDGHDAACARIAALGLPLLASIPDDRKIAEAYARGISFIGVDERMPDLFRDLAKKVKAL
ncbi:MAG: 4Fe-4S binding protein [Pseudomonadota bacterium]|nr:4Fe-4S binding protein [Pseudomonadota bacterium]